MSDLMLDDVAQRLYISALLGNPVLFARVQHLLKPSYFDPGLQSAIKFMQQFYQEHRGVPSVPVFHAGTKLNIEAAELPKQDIAFVAEQLASFCQIRAVTEAVLQSPALIEKGDYGQMLNKIKLATQVQLHTDLGIDYFADPEGRIALSESQDILIPTGWDSVDELIGGGIGREELILFAASSGHGKSIGMLNLGRNLLSQGLSGVYITLEMRDSIVAKRLDSILSRISGKNIFSNKLKVGQEVIAAKQSGYGQFFIKRMREGSTNADHVSSYLRELEAVHAFRPDFVILDYLDLMASVQKHSGDNMFSKDKLVSEEIRAIGFDHNCVIISASQLGRSAIIAGREEKKALDQAHIQGGMSKINTADLVIALVKDEAMEAAGEYRFEFLKARNSRAVNKKLTMAWDAESLRITDLGLKLKTTPHKSLGLNDVLPGTRGSGLQDLINLNPKLKS